MIDARVRRETGAVPVLLTAVSALLLASSFPPLDLGFVAWFGLTPFLLSLSRSGVLRAVLLGLLFGCVFCLGTFWWAPRIPSYNAINYLVSVLVFGSFFPLFSAPFAVVNRRFPSLSLIAAPSIWVAMEFVRSNIWVIAFPWALVGHSQHRFLQAIQIADIAGVYGVSFLVLLLNVIVLELIARKAWMPEHRGPLLRRVVPVALIPAAVLAYGVMRLTADPGVRKVRVGVVQANSVVRESMTLEERARHINLYGRLTLAAAASKPDLIAWPASSLPSRMTDRISRHGTALLAARTGIPLLVGGSGRQKDLARQEGDTIYANSEFLVSPDGRIAGEYHKVRLLPFNEYLPLRGIVIWPAWISSVRSDFSPGPGYTLFTVGGARFGTPICWENLFPETFRRFVAEGSDFIVSVSNESFFGDAEAPYRQSLAMSVFRAVENRVSVVRVTPTGISGFILPDGRISGIVRGEGGRDLFTGGVLVRDMPLRVETTFYTRWGDVFAIACVGLSIAALLPAFLGVGVRPRGVSP